MRFAAWKNAVKDRKGKTPEVSNTFLLGVFIDIGPFNIDYQEILAWKTLNKVDLSAWECRTLKRLSNEYIAQYKKSKDPKSIDPILTQGDPAKERMYSMMNHIKRLGAKHGSEQTD